MKQYNKNIRYYIFSQILSPAVLVWPIMTLYYQSKGLSFTDIALIQSIGAFASIIFDIPTAVLADKIGDKRFIVASGFLNSMAMLALLFSNNFYMFLITELIFAMADAAYSGAGQSFFYKNLIELNQTDNYKKITSKIKRIQIIVRTFSRLVSPFVFSVWKPAVFIISFFVYVCITILYSMYNELPKTVSTIIKKTYTNISLKKHISAICAVVVKHKFFLIISMLSLIAMMLASNYSQYIGPLLKEQGFKISHFGIILVCGNFSSYLGTYIIHMQKNNGEKINFYSSFKYLLSIVSILSVLLIVFYFSYTQVTTIVVYMLISFFHMFFTIYFSDILNKIVDNNYRATMISISNQIDNIGTIAIDPLIGIYIDASGFRHTYFMLGTICALVLAMLFILYLGYKGLKNGR